MLGSCLVFVVQTASAQEVDSSSPPDGGDAAWTEPTEEAPVDPQTGETSDAETTESAEAPDASVARPDPLESERGAAPDKRPVSEWAAPGDSSPARAVAPEPAPLEVGVSAFSRFELRNGYDRLGVSRGRFVEGDTTVYRVRLGLRTRPVSLGDGLEALVQFSPQASGQYGMVATVGEQSLGLYEGYLRIQSDTTSFDLGRFQLDYGEALVLGNLDWHQSGRAFEGARIRHQLGRGSVDAFVTQTPRAGEISAEGHPRLSRPVFAGDTYLWGVYAAVGGFLAEGLELDLYALGLTSAKAKDVPVDPEDVSAGTFTQNAANEVTLGIRAKDRFGEVFDYRVEAGVQTGTRRNGADGGRTTTAVRAFQADGEIGLSPVSWFRMSGGGAQASGNDPSTGRDEGWNELYPTGHRWLGLMDVAGPRNNIRAAVGKLRVQPTGSTTLHADYHYFQRLHVPQGADRALGSELDVYVVQKLGAACTGRVLYGAFVPKEGDRVAQYTEAELKLAF